MQRPAKMDKKLVRELKNLADPNMDPYDTVSGKTMCADDFYEGKIQRVKRTKCVASPDSFRLFLRTCVYFFVQ